MNMNMNMNMNRVEERGEAFDVGGEGGENGVWMSDCDAREDEVAGRDSGAGGEVGKRWRRCEMYVGWVGGPPRDDLRWREVSELPPRVGEAHPRWPAVAP